MARDSDPVVGHQRKRHCGDSSSNDSFGSFIHIKKTIGDFSKDNPFLISKLIQGLIGDAKSIKKIKDGLLVETCSCSQTKKLLSTTQLGEFTVSISEHGSLNSSKGVIYCRDLLNCSVEEILTELKSQGVFDVRRITTKKNGQVENTPSLVLSFNRRDVPKFVYAAMYRLPVRIYIPNPMRCFGCQRFGHSSSRCSNPKLCVCGKSPHESSPCSDYICVNCDGKHPSNSRNCPKFKLEYAVLEYKTVNKCSFPEARKHFAISSPSLKSSFANVTAMPQTNNSENLHKIVSLIVPEMKKIFENMFTEFAKVFVPQFQHTSPPVIVTETPVATNSDKTLPCTTVLAPLISLQTNKDFIVPNKQSLSLDVQTSSASVLPKTHMLRSTGSNISVPNATKSDSSQDSESSVTSVEAIKKKDRRGWVKGRSRSRKP